MQIFGIAFIQNFVKNHSKGFENILSHLRGSKFAERNLFRKPEIPKRLHNREPVSFILAGNLLWLTAELKQRKHNTITWFDSADSISCHFVRPFYECGSSRSKRFLTFWREKWNRLIGWFLHYLIFKTGVTEKLIYILINLYFEGYITLLGWKFLMKNFSRCYLAL